LSIKKKRNKVAVLGQISLNIMVMKSGLPEQIVNIILILLIHLYLYSNVSGGFQFRMMEQCTVTATSFNKKEFLVHIKEV
jgi:hypothetical protein